MKKIFKVLIALVLIAGLAFGAYFLISGKDNSARVHQNVYDLTNNIKNDDKNVVLQINNTVEQMRYLISVHSMQLDEISESFKEYLLLVENYSIISEHILDFGKFVKNNKIDEYIDNANISYKKTIDLYNKSYEYLKKTYYKIEDKNAYVENVKSYIQNFYEIFKDLIPEYNAFYYNTSLAYAYGLESTMQRNNFYKLQTAYYAESINQYYINTDNKVLLNVQVESIKNSLVSNTFESYFNNKAIYDEIISSITDINVEEIALKVALGKDGEILDSAETEAERKLLQNYITYVARG